ncbi:hypothetical protein GmHk_18G052217 [Glycine max]|nr:hypothetical protein GmHk_18G052217 [Glycine max]
MAPKKLIAKRSRKDATGEGSSAAPQVDVELIDTSSRVRNTNDALRPLKAERRVQLRNEEYAEFQEEIARRQWTQLVSPMAKYDPEIVMEFYANTWPTEEGVKDKCSWFLGHPLVWEEGQRCAFSRRRSQASDFNEEAIGQLLCIPGQYFALCIVGRRVQIMHTSMTTVTQIWMTLLLSNILPSDHNSDLPLSKCQLVYVAQLISDANYQFAGITPLRHPVDPEKSNKALRLVPILWSASHSHQAHPTSHQQSLHREVLHAQAGIELSIATARGGPTAASCGCTTIASTGDTIPGVHLQSPEEIRAPDAQSQDPSPFPWPTPDQFEATVAWPGDEVDFETRSGPVGAPRDDGGAQEDDNMVDVLDFFT